MNLYFFKYIDNSVMVYDEIKTLESILEYTDNSDGEIFSFCNVSLYELRKVFEITQINLDIVIRAIDLRGVDKIRGVYYMIDLDYRNTENYKLYNKYYDITLRHVRECKLKKLLT